MGRVDRYGNIVLGKVHKVHASHEQRKSSCKAFEETCDEFYAQSHNIIQFDVISWKKFLIYV
jgi:ABC-type transporter MlaC component